MSPRDADQLPLPFPLHLQHGVASVTNYSRGLARMTVLETFSSAAKLDPNHRVRAN